MRVHDILVEIKQRYGREYAENSRETIRRKVLHQFEQAGIAIRNADDLERPTNSGLNNYVLSDLVLDVVRSFGTPKWKAKSRTFVEQQNRFFLDSVSKRQGNRQKSHCRLRIGRFTNCHPVSTINLKSQSWKNSVHRFAPGSKLIYLGDTAKKTLVFDIDMFTKLQIPVSEHGKFPDVILYDAKKKWLFLIRAVTTHWSRFTKTSN